MEKVKIKVCTYNLQVGLAEGFKKRFALSLHRFYDDAPDIIGFQEALKEQQDIIEKWLPEYQVVGFGRGAKFDSESNCVAFRRDKFELYGFHQCWLSPTPYIPGTRFEEQSSCPRVVVDLLLKHKDRDLPFRYFNTHLDHIGEQARVLGMGQILKRIKFDNDLWNLPVILTGDMNALPDSEAIKSAVNFADYPLEDAAAALPYTFRREENGGQPKIDYIFVSKGTEHSEPYLWEDLKEGVEPSDHYPVVCDIVI